MASVVTFLSFTSQTFDAQNSSLKIIAKIPGEVGYSDCNSSNKTTEKFNVDVTYLGSAMSGGRDSTGCNKRIGDVGTTRTTGANPNSITFQEEEYLLTGLTPGMYRVRLSVGEKQGCKRPDGERSIVQRVVGEKTVFLYPNTQSEVTFERGNEKDGLAAMYVYPNPANTTAVATIETTNKAQGNLVIADLDGRILKSIDTNIKMEPGDYSWRFDISELPSGIYLVIFKQIGAAALTSKLVKVTD